MSRSAPARPSESAARSPVATRIWRRKFTSSSPWPLGILFSVVLLVGAALPASAAAPWLDDGAFPNWNASGAAIPRATTPDVPFQEICLRRERPATANDEERALAAAGWRLTDYWPSVRSGSLTVIVATSLYDGMCRPYDYNGFVFFEGRYVGRLAPTHLVSRTDGAIDSATIVSDGSIEARFIRYADRDPLCCPSRGQTRVTYRVANGVVGIASRQNVSARPAPIALPRTGGPAVPVEVVFTAGLVTIGAGAFLRRGLTSRGSGLTVPSADPGSTRVRAGTGLS